MNIDWSQLITSADKAAAAVPSAVSRVQAKLALLDAGKLDAVDTLVAASSDRRTKLWYDEAAMWERNNPRVKQLGAAVGLNKRQIDALFIAAAAIV